MKVCATCGEENPDRFRICGICGSALAVPIGAPESRRTVTVVFCDLKDSTVLSERLDMEPLHEVLGSYFAAMQDVIQTHGGIVEKYIGDAIMAVFGMPTAHEDDALRAVRAASEMRTRLIGLNDDLERRWGVRLENRTGVNTGEVVASDATSMQRLVTGSTVNMAARLEQAAAASEILLGEATYALVRDAIEVERIDTLVLKGIIEPVTAYRLIAVTGREGVARRSEAQIVGRHQELEVLHDAFRRAREGGASRWLTILGPAGTGKSRLLGAFLASADDSTILRGGCLSYGQGITFWPLIEAIRSAAEIDDGMSIADARERLADLCAAQTEIVERLAPLLGLSDASYPLEETFWAVRRLLEKLAETAPVVFLVEDIHWAEATLLDLIEELARECVGPILVLCSARVDLLERRPGWGDGSAETVLNLRPLDDAHMERIIGNLLEANDVPRALVDRLVRAAEGNPLYVEQMVSMLVDRGVLSPADDGSWKMASDGAEIPIPPSISALLTSRIDELAPEDRAVLQAGSVVGLEFYRGAVEAMSRAEVVPHVPTALGTLVRRQFVATTQSSFIDEATYRFGHILIRDAAYGVLLLRLRIDLHERFARWLERTAGPRLAELEEIVGYHLEQCARYLAELGPLDERGLLLAASASERLARSGARAFSRGDTPATANLLGRAVTLLPHGDRTRTVLLLDLAEAQADLGQTQEAGAALHEAIDAAVSLGDPILATNAALVRQFVHFTIDPQGRSEEVVRETTAAIPILEAAGDHNGLVRAWRLRGWVSGTACRYGDAELAVRQAVEHARLAGDRRAVTRNQMSFAIAALHGPMPVPEAITLCERIVADVGGDRRAEGVVLGAMAHLNATAGAFELARQQYGRARQILEDLGGRMMAATVSLDSGRVELLAGRPDLAERELRRDYDVLTEIDERYALPTVAALLAAAVHQQGRPEEALVLTVVSEEAAAEDDVESQNLWRRVRALILLELGRDDEALRLSGEALRLVEPTDAPLLRAGTLLDRAMVQVSAGRLAEARTAADEAHAIYQAKQDAVDSARAEALLVTLRR